MISGPQLFSRYAQPPNLLGYCGPDASNGVMAVADGVVLPSEEMITLAMAFHGAWPYLELIGRLTGRQPLSSEVVEAYWIGNEILGEVDLHNWGHSVSDRFRDQAGARWSSVERALNRGGAPNHAFHVFCIYPWIGLLREGYVGPALEVLDRCRISWGRVMDVGVQTAVVRRRPLTFVDGTLRNGDPIDEPYRRQHENLSPGDVVSVHWDFICQRLEQNRARILQRTHDHHLRIANRELRSARLEPAH